jgi:hypothetical protein
MSSWLIIGMAVLVMWALWGFMNWVLNVLGIYLDSKPRLPRSREDSSTTRETERS